MKIFDPRTRYNVIDADGLKVGEVVKGELYEAAPDYRQKVGTVAIDTEGDRLTFLHHGAIFELVPQQIAWGAFPNVQPIRTAIVSYNVTRSAVEDELQLFEVLLGSIPKGLDSMEYTVGECTGLVLCLSRLKLITEEQKETCLSELKRLHALGLDQREINANWAKWSAHFT